MREADYTTRVIDLLKLRGWLVFHHLPAQFRSGKWASATQGDTGLPDIVAVRAPRLIFAELKVGKNKPSPNQVRWLNELRGVPGVETYVWYPTHWSEIQEIAK